MPNPNLEAAYALDGKADTKQLYADWAETYDASFASEMGFILPTAVARMFSEIGGRGPVLDFGAGTGLLGVDLAARGIAPVDALDLSAEMLAVAAQKRVYRSLIAGNLLEGLDLPDRYTGIVSSGTFTHGHVGPEGLDALLSVAEPGARFALSINKEHYRAADFEQAFAALSERITDLFLPEVDIYGPDATGAHKDDKAYIACFRLRG